MGISDLLLTSWYKRAMKYKADVVVLITQMWKAASDLPCNEWLEQLLFAGCKV